MTLLGLILLFSKSGRGVIASTTDRVIQSDDSYTAKPFLVVPCRAMDTVTEEERPGCVSLMDPNRTDWFVRHRGYYLYVEPEFKETNLPRFKLDSSFILHTESFYPGYFALRSVNYPTRYIRLLTNGYLLIDVDDRNPVRKRSLSFKLYEYNTFRTYRFFVYFSGRVVQEGRWGNTLKDVVNMHILFLCELGICSK